MKKHKILYPIVSVLLVFVLTLLIVTKTAFFASANVAEVAINLSAKSALLMDQSTGTIVYEKDSKKHLPIASMVKIMTLLVIFEEIESGNLDVNSQIIVSENASSMGGSQAFLDANNSYNVNELIKTIVVASANDSCVALAEHISGSVEVFADRMNAKAKELTMDNTNFINCTGLPAPNQYSCAYDVGLMTREMLNHKQFFAHSTVWMFDFNHPSGRHTALSNTNRLLRSYEGCDGGKTGFTNEAMFCLSATAKRGSTRLVSIILGCETSKVRNSENIKLFNFGFANYETKQVVFKGVETGEYPVLKGKEKSVVLVPESDFFIFTKKNSSADINATYNVSEINAPVSNGQVLGELVVTLDGKEMGKVALASSKDIAKLTYLDIVNEMIKEW